MSTHHLKATNLLASGAFGLVWKMHVTSQSGGKEYPLHCAVKEVKTNISATTTTREMELLASASSVSDHVIQLHSHFGNGQQLFYCMECFGSSLADILETRTMRDASLNVPQITFGILSALRDIHAIGIVHRDLKPANILVDLTTSKIKLIDFGSATYYQRQSTVGFAPVVGTLEYRAPEMLFGSTQYNEKIDLWSTGMILWELLSPNAQRPLIPATNEFDSFLRLLFLLGAPTESEVCEMVDGPSRTMLLELLESLKANNRNEHETNPKRTEHDTNTTTF